MNSVTTLSGTVTTYTPQTPAQQTTIVYTPINPVTGLTMNWPINIQLRQDCIVSNKVQAQATVTLTDLVALLVTATPALSPPPVVITQPAPMVCIHGVSGASSTFGVEMAFPSLNASITYQWQESQNNGTSWTNLSNTTVYSNVTTNQITVTPPTTAWNGYLYRCVATGGAGSTTSNTALLTVT